MKSGDVGGQTIYIYITESCTCSNKSCIMPGVPGEYLQQVTFVKK